MSKEMEEPAFKGMVAEVDWERGEGAFIPGLWWGFPFVRPFEPLRSDCLGVSQ